MSLFRLSYYSTNLLKQSRDPAKSGLRSLIAAAQKRNGTVGITGGLMFNKNYFGQILEGERRAVSNLFCRIAKDPRHESIVIMEAAEVSVRVFDRWSMGLAGQSETADILNAKFGLQKGFDPADMTSADFLAYVLEMVATEQNLISVAVPTWEVP